MTGGAGVDLLAFLDELQVLARNGLLYADNPYDRGRYERILELVSEAYSEAVDLPAPEIRSRLGAELGHVTPKLGADAAVFDDAGRILLVRRADDRLWGLPCGWVEPAESPAEAAVRETREETGLEVRIVELVGAIPRLPSERNGPHAVVSVVFLAEVVGGELATSSETVEAAYRELSEVKSWHRNHEELATAARRCWRSRGGNGP